jgi:hypothetical protein
MEHLMRLHRTFILTIGAAALLAAAGCGSSGPYGSNGSSGSNGSAAGSSTPTLKITSPAAGATVTEPFTLKLSSSTALGPTSTGNDHVHLFIDGGSSYKVVTSTKAQIKGLSPGKHTILVTLQHADHSPVGPKARITVTVAGASGATPSSSPTSDGYGY